MSELIGFFFSIVDWIAVSLSILGILLNAKKNIKCWPVWIASNICWLLYFLPKEEWSSVSLWVVFVGFNSYGWIQWNMQRNENGGNEDE